MSGMELVLRPSERGQVAGLIRQARVDAGLSQAGLAERLGTAQSVVSRWERGADEPRLGTLARILAACDRILVLRAEEDGVDRAQIRQQLAMSPADRLASATNLSRMRSEARRRS